LLSGAFSPADEHLHFAKRLRATDENTNWVALRATDIECHDWVQGTRNLDANLHDSEDGAHGIDDRSHAEGGKA